VGRRDFSFGLLPAIAPRAARAAQEPAKQHRSAIVIPAGAVAIIRETSSDALRRRFYHSFFGELRRLDDVEGQILVIERYTGEGRPEGFASLAREVIGRNPDLIVAQTNPVALAMRTATGTIPIVFIGHAPPGFSGVDFVGRQPTRNRGPRTLHRAARHIAKLS
jgi:putative tryptophan/tyrosine transport system substrate-binding protein